MNPSGKTGIWKSSSPATKTQVSEKMTIFLNGKEHALDQPVSVQTLLESIGLGNKPVVVELNKKALFPREYPDIVLAEGARVEIITIAAGG